MKSGRRLWESIRKNALIPELPILVPDLKGRVIYKFDKKVETAYATMTGKGNYAIVMGDKMILDLLSKFKVKDKDTRLQVAAKLYLGLGYHEDFHLRYTDMTLKRIKAIKNQAFASMAAQLNNILEDVYLQYVRGIKDVPFTEEYFEFLDQLVFPTKELMAFECEDKLDNVMNYILITLKRRGLRKLDHPWLLERKETYVEFLNKFFNQHNPDLRIQVAIDMTEWLLKEFGHDEVDKDAPAGMDGLTEAIKDLIDKMRESGMSDEEIAEALESMISPSSEEGKELIDKAPTRMPARGEPSHGAPTDTFDAEAEVVEGTPDKSDKSDKDIDGDDPKTSKIVKELGDIDGMFADCNHHFVPVEDYADGNNYFNEDHMTLINQLSRKTTKAIELITDREMPRWIAGQERGMLHIPSVISRNDHRVFRAKTRLVETPHLAMSIMLDNSGSIGSYAEYEALAAAVVAKAAEELDIPIEVNAFTSQFDGRYKDNTFYTLEVKPFEMSHKKSLPNYTISLGSRGLRSDREFSTFAGNMEEVNLKYTLERFKALYPDRKKVMVVFCDGATTGSKEALARLIKEQSKDVYIVGIGMGADLSRLYTHSKRLNHGEFGELPNLLSELFKGFVLER